MLPMTGTGHPRRQPGGSHTRKYTSISTLYNHPKRHIINLCQEARLQCLQFLFIRDMLELKQIRLSLPRAIQPPDTHSYIPPILSGVPVELLPLLPDSAPPTPIPATPIASPTPSTTRMQSPSPPATPPPIPPSPAKKFNMAFLPLLDASSSPSLPSPPSTLSVTPASPLPSTSGPTSEDINSDSAKPEGGSNHLPTPDASPLHATSPLATPNEVDLLHEIFTPSTLADFPAPPDTLPTNLCAPDPMSATASSSPILVTTSSTSSPSPDSHPSLHSYFHIRLGLPAHLQNTSTGGLPDSPFVDPAHDRSPAVASDIIPADDFVAQAQAASTAGAVKLQAHLQSCLLRGVPSPTLVPPSPFSLSPSELADAQKQLGRASSLRRTAFAEFDAEVHASREAREPAPAPPRKPRKKEYMMINDILVEVESDEPEEDEEEDAHDKNPALAPASPRAVPLPASPSSCAPAGERL